MRNNNGNNGYTHGGRDVTESINLFFKGLLISPILILACAVSIGMIKNLLFMGVPTINTPSNEQIEQIRQRDRQIVPQNGYPQLPAPRTSPQPAVTSPKPQYRPVAPVWKEQPTQTVSTPKYTRAQCEAELSNLSVTEGPVYDALKNTCRSI